MKAISLNERQRMNGYRVLSLDYNFPNSTLTLADILADESVDVCEEVCEKLSRTPSGYELSHTYSISPALSRVVLKEVL